MSINPNEFIDAQTDKGLGIYQKTASRVHRTLKALGVIATAAMVAAIVLLSLSYKESAHSTQILEKVTGTKAQAAAQTSTAFLVRCIENHDDRSLAQALNAAQITVPVPSTIPGCP